MFIVNIFVKHEKPKSLENLISLSGTMFLTGTKRCKSVFWMHICLRNFCFDGYNLYL